MTIFARRRLQSMLNDLAPTLGVEKGRDILRRLNDRKQVDQALPAEMELALLWAIRSLGDLEVEPEWWADSRRPDAITEALAPGRIAAIEIAATTDNAISGEEDMDAIAVQIGDVANRGRKGAGDHLYYRFREESGYVNGQYIRRRLAPRGLKLTPEQIAAITTWVKSNGCLTARLRLQAKGLEVEIEHTERKQIRYHNLYSSMPPETHSLEENPLFDLLVRKARQLRAAAPDTLRILFVADVGSTLLRRVGRSGEIDHTRRFVSAREIISHFLQVRSRTVDAVVTFSPLKEQSSFLGGDSLGRKPRRWTVAFFGTPKFAEPPLGIEKIAAMLPEPHYEGYQARSLFRQGAFSPSKTGQYLGMTIRGNHGTNTFSVEFPARMLLDLLAGRLTEERFRAQLDGRGRNQNIFKTWLDRGLTISGAEMAPRSVDEDDDHLILHFTDDSAARPFELPSVSPADSEIDGS
jgi:hypothetical protein